MKSVHGIVVNIFLEEKKHCLRSYLFDMNYRLHNTGSKALFRYKATTLTNRPLIEGKKTSFVSLYIRCVLAMREIIIIKYI